MLPVEIEVVQYPYGDVTKDVSGNEMLPLIIAEIANKLRERIEEACHTDAPGYRRNSAVVMLDPTAEAFVPSFDTIMFTICIGEKGRSFLLEAVDKACGARHRAIMGFSNLRALHPRGNGRSRNKLTSVGNRGFFNGTAGHDSNINITEGHKVENDFSEAIIKVTREWHERHASHSWYNNKNWPHPALQQVHNLGGQRFTVDASGRPQSFSE